MRVAKKTGANLNGTAACADLRQSPDGNETGPGAVHVRGVTGGSQVRAVHLHRHAQIADGKLAEFEKSFADLVNAVEASEPRMLAFNGYANEEGKEVAVVQVHADTDSMELHMQVVARHIEHAYESLLEETPASRSSDTSASQPAG